MSSYSRLNTPSPNPRATSNNRSPVPQSSASSSSRPTLTRSRHSLPAEHLSGSETEREEHETHHAPLSSNSHSTSSHSSTSTSSHRPTTPHSQGSARLRLTSAPESPAKALLGMTSISGTVSGSSNSSSSNHSNSPSRSRKRVSLALTDLSYTRSISRSPEYSEDRDDVTHMALAAVASSRRSPTGGSGKKRQPLPREFLDANGTSGSRRGSLDAAPSGDARVCTMSSA